MVAGVTEYEANAISMSCEMVEHALAAPSRQANYVPYGFVPSRPP